MRNVNRIASFEWEFSRRDLAATQRSVLNAC